MMLRKSIGERPPDGTGRTDQYDFHSVLLCKRISKVQRCAVRAGSIFRICPSGLSVMR